MNIVVQKFGGTSMATPEGRRAARKKVVKSVEEGNQPVVVVSAMGRSGDPYATDTLINLLHKENNSVSRREMDFIMSCGENISAAVMAANLQDAGLKAQALTGGQAGIVTDGRFGAARIIKVSTDHIMELLDDGVTPVICGFQGATEDARGITTIGRGGSDTTAAALGAALRAKVVEIYTDVDGIMTADPRIVKDAKVVNTISYGEICQLAYEGAKVIHPRAVEIAMQKNVPLLIKSTFSDAPGTLITNDLGENAGDIPITGQIASGVTYISDISQVRVKVDEQNTQASMQVFSALAANNVNVECLNVNPGELIFTVEETDLEKTEKLLRDDGFDRMQIERECAKVSVVGAGMRGVPGVMSTFVRSFVRLGIPILQTVDSNLTISAVVERKHLSRALAGLHEVFGLAKNCGE